MKSFKIVLHTIHFMLTITSIAAIIYLLIKVDDMSSILSAMYTTLIRILPGIY